MIELKRHTGRTLLSVAFDLDSDRVERAPPPVAFDLDFDREGHGLSRAARQSVLKGRGFKPRRKVPEKTNPASAAEGRCPE